jgi:hypothetical protein
MTPREYAARMRALKWWTLVYVSWFGGTFGMALWLFRDSTLPTIAQIAIGVSVAGLGLAIANTVERRIIRSSAKRQAQP